MKNLIAVIGMILLAGSITAKADVCAGTYKGTWETGEPLEIVLTHHNPGGTTGKDYVKADINSSENYSYVTVICDLEYDRLVFYVTNELMYEAAVDASAYPEVTLNGQEYRATHIQPKRKFSIKKQ